MIHTKETYKTKDNSKYLYVIEEWHGVDSDSLYNDTFGEFYLCIDITRKIVAQTDYTTDFAKWIVKRFGVKLSDIPYEFNVLHADSLTELEGAHIYLAANVLRIKIENPYLFT